MDDFLEFVPPRAIASPCVNVCRIDRAARLCRGCARTIDEIARWTTLTEAARETVLADLPRRRSRLQDSQRDSQADQPERRRHRQGEQDAA